MKTLKSKILTLILCVTMLFSAVGFSACGNSEIATKNTNLEFWITENVDDVDFSEYKEIYGWMGARQFYGKDYQPAKDKNGDESKPKYYVTYLITAYPDYADGGAYVTQIEITDPDIYVYGLTINSSFEEFDTVFSDLGYELFNGAGALRTRVAQKDGIKFYLTEDTHTLKIVATVSNREGIVF